MVNCGYKKIVEKDQFKLASTACHIRSGNDALCTGCHAISKLTHYE